MVNLELKALVRHFNLHENSQTILVYYQRTFIAGLI